MRTTPILIIFLSLFGFCHCVPPIEDILATNQYLLVTQQGCLTQIETDVKPGFCPQLLQKPPKSTVKCTSEFVRMHLLREPDGKKAPKLGLVHRIRDSHYFQVLDINATEIWKEGADRSLYNFETVAESSNTMIYRDRKGMKLITSLFDSSTQWMYFMYLFSNKTSNSGELFLDSFFISDIFNDSDTSRAKSHKVFKTFTPQHPFCGDLALRPHKINFERFDWSEDPYTNEFFYREKQGSQIVTFSAPFTKLTQVILMGQSGTVIQRINDERGHMSHTGGLLSEKKVAGKDKKKTVVSYITPTNTTISTGGIMCQYNDDNATFPHFEFNPVIAIRDFDYCLIKYGNQYPKNKCDDDRFEWYVSKGLMEPHSESSLTKWLIITVIGLTMLVALLFAYIYWLRTTFAVEGDDSLQNDQFEHEASSFVARQRSFPSAYPDPALLDVSVDKWN